MKNHFHIATILARLLDEQFSIGKFRFGLDPLINLVPWIGDVVGLILSLYLVWIAKNARVPQKQINKMIKNVILDFVVGLIPVLGNFGDFVIKANSRNLEILRKYGNFDIVEGKVAYVL